MVPRAPPSAERAITRKRRTRTIRLRFPAQAPQDLRIAHRHDFQASLSLPSSPSVSRPDQARRTPPSKRRPPPGTNVAANDKVVHRHHPQSRLPTRSRAIALVGGSARGTPPSQIKKGGRSPGANAAANDKVAHQHYTQPRLPCQAEPLPPAGSNGLHTPPSQRCAPLTAPRVTPPRRTTAADPAQHARPAAAPPQRPRGAYPPGAPSPRSRL